MDSISEMRRDFHQYPELGFMEFRTASTVVESLLYMGFDVEYGREVMDEGACMGVPDEKQIKQAYSQALQLGANEEILQHMQGGFTGVIGKMSGNKPGPTVAFRFDMDALPISEEETKNHYPYRENFHSKNTGKMHACGHDGHTAIGLCLADSLKSGEFSGTLMLIFQPAEEGGRGAASIASKGVLDNVDKLYCMHLGLSASKGELFCGTTGWLATTKMESTYYGVSSHAGASPEMGKNALIGAATALLNIHAIPRYSDGITRVNVGELHSGTAINVIPDKAIMAIETRSDKKTYNEDLKKRVKKIIEHSAKMYDLEYDIKIIGEGTTITCDSCLMDTVFEAAEKINSFHSIQKIGVANGSEDASILMKRVQDCGGKATYMLVGTELPAPHHNPAFDIDEGSLQDAVKLLRRIAIKELM